MGQYFLIANLDKKEYLSPHQMGTGAKLWEIAANCQQGILPYLLRQSDVKDGIGDLNPDRTQSYPNAGRWAGDRIVVVGDYDESGLYDKIDDKEWSEITPQAGEDYNAFRQKHAPCQVELDDFEERMDKQWKSPPPQIFHMVNLDKKEFINSKKVRGLNEFSDFTRGCQIGVLPYMLRKSSGGGGGDMYGEHAGRWAEDRVALVGELDGLPLHSDYKDISNDVRHDYNDAIEIDRCKI